MSDYAKFVEPLDGAQPCGPNLEYDASFLEFERSTQGKPEQEIGSKKTAAEMPDWAGVRDQADALLQRTRDLRVTIPLSLALLRIDGFAGLAAGLGLTRGLLENQWEGLHPQLDADDGNDPTVRMNALLGLVSAEGMLRGVREVPVVRSAALGRFGLRDIRIASGRLQPSAGDTAPAQQAQVDGAFLDAPLEELKATALDVEQAAQHLDAIARVTVDKVGSAAPELKPLAVDLAEIRRILAEKLAVRGVGQGDTASGGAATTPGAAGGSLTGDIANRDDVVRMLDRICDYYRKHEPSSPIPLLLQRAKRLVSKDFMEIVRDLTPAGVTELELISGFEKKE